VKNKEKQMVRATAQLKVEELSSELISQLEILCEQDEEAAESFLNPADRGSKVQSTGIFIFYGI
jgi:hypothetical protein